MGTLANCIDSVLEWTIAGSFTRVGFVLRRRLDHWTPVDELRLDGRVVVITGATSGIGLEAARSLARMGATVEIVARNEGRAEAVCAELRRQTQNENVGFVVADMGDLLAVRRAAQALASRHDAIDVLIQNAGALDDIWQSTAQGIEVTVATHVVGPFLLTTLLVPLLRAGAPSRVLWVSSGGMYAEPLSVERLESGPDEFDGTRAYARAKRAQVTLSAMWAEKLDADGISVHAMHPGWADTPGVARSLPTFRRIVGKLLRTPAEGADTLVWLAAANAAELGESGRFWLDRRARTIHRLASTRRADTPDERARLWNWAVEMSERA